MTAVRRALPAGDYSVAGLESMVAVERKTLDDFVSTVIRARGRFRANCASSAGYARACIVVEADLADVLQGRYRGDAHPNAVLGSALSIILDYRRPGLLLLQPADRLPVRAGLSACARTRGGIMTKRGRTQEADGLRGVVETVFYSAPTFSAGRLRTGGR